MTTMGVTAMSGFGILLAAFAATTILRKRSASLRHLVWTVALGLLVAVPAFHSADLRVEVPVPAEWAALLGIPSAASTATETPRQGASEGVSGAMSRLAVGRSTGGGGQAAGDGFTGSSEHRSGGSARATRADVGGGSGAGIGSVGREGAGRNRVGRSTAGSDVAGGGSAQRNGSRSDRAAEAGGAVVPPSGDFPSMASDDAAVGMEIGTGVAAVTASGTRMVDFVVLVWALGAMVLLAGTFFSHLAARRLVTAGVERASPRAARRFAQLCLDLGVRHPVRLVVNPRIRVPATWGFRRATVVLPAQYEEWGEETLERVLLHELAHVQRGDCLAAVLGETARALHWPNPLAWVALARQRAESEHACDDIVLRTGEAPSEYAHDLLRLVRSFSTSAPLPEASLAMARPSGLGRRVRAVLDPAQHRGATRRSVGIGVGVIALLSAFGATAVVPVVRAQEEPTRVVPAPPEAADATVPVEPISPELFAPEAFVPGEPSSQAPASPDMLFEPTWPPIAEHPEDPDPGHEDLFASHTRRAPSILRFALLPQIDPAQEMCVFQGEGRRSTSISSDRDEIRIQWETDACSIDIDVRGEVEWAADDSGIARMERGARFDIEEEIGRDSKRARLDGTATGIRYRYWVDGDEVDWGPEAEAWLGRILPEIFRHTTINSEARVRRFLAEGGTQRVFQEVEQIHSDHVTAHYLELLMRETSLREEEYARIIDYAGQLESDHTSGELLLTVVETAGLRPAFQRPILRAAENLESDHQKTRVLQALLESDLGPSQLDAVVESATTIESDHNLAELLTVVATTGRLSDVGRASFQAALESIESDHNQGRVLEAFLDSGRLSDRELTDVIATTMQIESDHQKAVVLERIARDFPLTGDQVTAYLRSASDISSDHQLATTAGAIIERADFTREHLALVLTMADQIDSDHQRGTVLERVILRQELSTPELEEVLMVAEGVDSDHQLAAILTMILEDETLSQDGVLAVLHATRGLGASHQRTSVLVQLAGIYDLRGDALQTYEELADDLGRQNRRRVMEAIRG